MTTQPRGIYGYIVLRDMGVGQSNGWVNKVTTIHQTEVLARLEAERLVKEHGGRFLVFEGNAAVSRAEPPVAWSDAE